MKNIVLLGILLVSLNIAAQNSKGVKEGEMAPDFTLEDIDQNKVRLSDFKNKNVVLIVLRGWPEYQCPVCSRQVGGLIAAEKEFASANAVVVMVYPGKSDNLINYAKEFSEDFTFPKNYYFLLDPDYSMINNYGLRWDAPKETAYPSTFVINKKGNVVFSKISQTHGGRSKIEEILEVL